MALHAHQLMGTFDELVQQLLGPAGHSVRHERNSREDVGASAAAPIMSGMNWSGKARWPRGGRDGRSLQRPRACAATSAAAALHACGRHEEG
ncbi:hypothetical protein GCM10009849_26510 [Sinomonas flava]|uniref:Uncharacterized protein n=1 Tax=Sinomonas flava TaxID=496857 RepID=A0ABN3BXD7_9MICC